MKPRGLVWSLVVFVLGLLVGNNLGIVKAQGDIQPEQAWEINHAPFGQSSFAPLRNQLPHPPKVNCR